jgi:chromosome segregation ATPase
MAPSQKPININITSNGEDLQVPNEYNEFREYIVKNNIILQNDIKLKVGEVKELEAKIQEHEEEENKYDSRMRYMKGLLQNLNELRSMYSNVKDKTEQKTEIIREHNKTTKTIYYEIYAFLIITNIATLVTPFSLEYYNWFNLLLQMLYFAGLPYSLYKIKTKYCSIHTISKESTNRMKEKTQEINKIKDEIKKIEDSCISLDNWICEL